MNYALNLPINTVSFGQVSVALLREIYKKEHQPCLFPIGNLEINAQKEDKDFFCYGTSMGRCLHTVRSNFY